MKKLLIVLIVAAVPGLSQAQDPESGDITPQGESDAAEWGAAEEGPTEPQAQGVERAEQPAEPAPSDEDDDEPEYDTRYPNKKYIDAVLERSQHPSLGYALGRHGDGFIFGPRFDLPITKTGWGYLQFFQYTNFGTFRSPMDPVLQLGVNFISHSDLMFGMFRVYGGGGFFVAYRPSPACRNPLDQKDITQAYVYEGLPASTQRPTEASAAADPSVARVAGRIDDIEQLCEDQKDPFTISGGGTGGIEFFVSPMRAYFIELSGGGGAQKNGIWNDTGLVLRAGNQFYF